MLNSHKYFLWEVMKYFYFIIQHKKKTLIRFPVGAKSKKYTLHNFDIAYLNKKIRVLYQSPITL